MSLSSPFDPDEINRRWPVLEARVAEKLAKQGVPAKAVQFHRFGELRYQLQINQVAVPAEGGVYDAAAVERLVATFEAEYERLYGKGSGFAGVGFGLTSLQVHGTAKLSGMRVGDLVQQGGDASGEASKKLRDVTWYGRGGKAETTAVYDGAKLGVSFTAPGPAIIEYPDTTVVVPHGCTAAIDSTGSVVIDLHASA